MMWTAEVQIVNKDMVIAVVIAILAIANWSSEILGGVNLKLLNCNYHCDNGIFI